MKKITDTLIVAFYSCLFAFFPMVIGRMARVWFKVRYRDGEQRYQEWYHKNQAAYCRFFLCKSIPGVKVRIDNPFGEDFVRPAIIIANHQSMLDIPAIFMLHPRIVGMAKEALFRNRFFASMTKYKELISNATPVRTVLAYAQQKLSLGFSFLIYPEGSRSEDLRIQPFHAGAFFFAESLKCDIIPVTLWGTGKVLHVSNRVGKSDIVVEIGERKSYDGMNRKQMAEYWHNYFLERLKTIEEKQNFFPHTY